MEIVLEGRPISKKNSKQIIPVRGRHIMIPSKAFAKFRLSALEQLGRKGLGTVKPPYEISYRFYMKGKLDTDNDNMQAGINDILEEAGILENDKLIDLVHAEKIRECPDWLTELDIKHLER